MTFGSKYRLEWVITYHRPTTQQPEQFDLEVVDNTLKESYAVVKFGEF